MGFVRYSAFALGLLTAAPAWAEPANTPVVIESFAGSCFDAARLKRRIAERDPSVPLVELAPRIRHLVVQIAGQERGVSLRLSSRDANGALLGAELRILPSTSECDELLEAAALIVVRSATPMHAAASRAPERAPTPRRPTAVHAIPPSAPSPLTATPSPVTPAPTPASTPDPIPAPPAPAVAIPTPAPTVALAVASRRPRRPRIELDLAGGWSFPLDGVRSAPRGALTLALDLGRFGVGIHAAVQGEVRTELSTEIGKLTLGVRGLPLAVLARADFPVSRGAFRVTAGPALLIWSVHASGLPHPGAATVLAPGAIVGASYRLLLGRYTIEGGVTLTTAFTRETLIIDGYGAVGHTALISLAPFLGAGVRL